MPDYSVNDNPMIFLNINGEKRWADAGWDPKKQQYWTLLPAKNLQDSAYPAGDGTEPDVQGHLATFDKDGKLLGVQAMHWGVEGGLDGFYPTEWPTPADSVYNANAAKTYAPQVFKQVKRQEKNGGNMNYSQYLQEGGAAEDQMGQVISQVIAALKQNPEETLKKLKEMGEQGDQLLEMAVQADPELQQMFSNAMKCGGKVKAKVKKKEVGGFVRKAGTGCACQLKKVGGRLIEVDGCTGLPVKRNGGIMKFETPAQGIKRYDLVTAAAQKAQEELKKQELAAASNTRSVINGERTVVDSDGTERILSKIGEGATSYIDRSKYTLGPDGIWRPKPSSQSTTTQNSEAGAGTQYTIGQAGTGANAGKVWNGRAFAAQTDGQINAARAGMTNEDGTGWNLARRKEWMNSEEGKAYLASINNGQGLGFTADQYAGTAAQNRALFGAYGGFADWKNKQSAQNVAHTPNVFGNDMTNQQLLQYDPNAEGAQALSEEATARRQRLVENQKAQDAYKKSLIRDGIQYDNPYAYEEAVDAENDRRDRAYKANILRSARSVNDSATTNRFMKTQNTLDQDQGFQNLMKGVYYVGGKKALNPAAIQYIKEHYKGADRIRAMRLAEAQAAAASPVHLSGWSGPERPQAFDPNATTFKQGGLISYKNYITSFQPGGGIRCYL